MRSKAFLFALQQKMAFMPSESANPRQSAIAKTATVSEAECNASVVTDRFAGKGWTLFEEMAGELGWRHSRRTSVLRWLKQESPIFIFESKLSRGVAKVRITKVTLESKQARQLATDISSQLAKLYTKLKHTDRNREKLASDVRTIASRIAPFLENREFQIQYRRFKRQLNEPQQETQMEAGVESSDHPISAAQSRIEPPVSAPRADIPSPRGFDRRALPRLVLIASMFIIGAVIFVFLTATLLHALEVLSHYVERINAQTEL